MPYPWGMRSIPEDRRTMRSPGQTLMLRESGCRLALKNDLGSDLEALHTDGWLPQDGLSCDYLLCADVEGEPRGCCVELKGGGLDHAVKQLASTFTAVKKECGKGLTVVSAVIVRSGANIPQQRFLKLVTQFKTAHRVPLRSVRSMTGKGSESVSTWFKR